MHDGQGEDGSCKHYQPRVLHGPANNGVTTLPKTYLKSTDKMAAMKNVLSPSSETMMTEREARKPWRKLSSDTMEPCSASSSAGDSDLS